MCLQHIRSKTSLFNQFISFNQFNQKTNDIKAIYSKGYNQLPKTQIKTGQDWSEKKVVLKAIYINSFRTCKTEHKLVNFL